MEKIRKIFRNPAFDILFIIGLAISCIILINISELVSKISIEEESRKAYTYTSRIAMFCSEGEEQSKYIIDFFSDLGEGNVYLTESVHIDRQRDGIYAYVLIGNNEELLFDYKEGGYDKGRDYDNAVIIGESLEQYVFEEDGNKYLEIDNERYSVIGILENNMSAQIDTSLYILWSTVDKEIKEQWIVRGFPSDEIYYESNVSEQSFYESLATELFKYGTELEYIGNERNTTDGQNEVYKTANKILLGIGLIFSVCTVFCVSNLWLMNRRKEIAIRKAYGYSNGHVFKMLISDTLYLLVPTFVVAILVQGIYSVFMDTHVSWGEKIVLKMLVVFVGILVIVFVNTLYLMRNMNKFNVSMINEEK